MNSNKEQFKINFNKFLSKNKYLTEKEYEAFLNKNKNLLNIKHYNQLLLEKNKYLKNHNNKYLIKILKEKEQYFNDMFKSQDPNIKLDKEQLKAIIADENLLVIAGAGAGKTTTMAAKVKYLVDSGYKEDEILVISFTKKACEEIENIIHNTLNCHNVKVTTLAKLYDAKIMAVGDDWQTIYSFAGANISLFRDFKKYVDHAKRIPIKNTYRNSQELIDIAGEFVKQNKYLIKKELKSNKHLANPIEIYVYDDSKKQVEDYANALTISKIISKIIENTPKHKILLLGRYNKDKDMLLYTEYFNEYRGKIVSKLNPKANITFLTVHKSKGVGYDDVILINASDKLYGFPSKIEDKPIIKLLKNEPNEAIKYPEERRLFYVAMTRTKNKFYITVPQSKKSSFIKEIAKYNNVMIHKEITKYNSLIKTNYICPDCNNKLYMKNYKKTGFYIYCCPNNNCNFQTMFPKELERLEKCPLCGEIVTYRYTNNSNERIYKCINEYCNYKKIKYNKNRVGE